MYVILDAVIISLSYVDAHGVAYLAIFSSETPIKHWTFMKYCMSNDYFR
jgi:hypothetical protein